MMVMILDYKYRDKAQVGFCHKSALDDRHSSTQCGKIKYNFYWKNKLKEL